ncbi:MAG: exo-alpha-sialidase [Bryobacterales bacterium]|nr:exo-alpha-sialidase [Bryobacterales bacterium]
MIPLLLALAVAPVEQVDLFRQGDAGVHTYRIPALVETKKGTLIAVADARYDNPRDLPGRIALVMRRSFDRGRTWSAAQTIRQVKEGGAGDASLLLDRDTGRVWCFFAYGPPGIGWPTAKPGERTGANTLQLHAMWSGDEGATWTDPVDLTPQIKDPAWQAMFATSGTAIQTSTGRFLVPLVVRGADGVVASRNAYSDDHGKTWRVGAAIGKGTDESHNVELAGGLIMQNMRNGPRRAVATSRDGGVTFGEVTHDEELVDPSCNAGIVRYRRKGHDLLVFTNAASARRENLTVKTSADGGQTWRTRRTLQAGPAAYSTVIVLRDGTLGVLYERGETSAAERITFARFALDSTP